MKRLVCFMLAAVLSCSVFLTGCSSGKTEDSQGAQADTVWTHGSPQQPIPKPFSTMFLKDSSFTTKKVNWNQVLQKAMMFPKMV